MDGNMDFGSDRIEVRTCYVAKGLTFIEGVLAWKGIKSVIVVHATRESRGQL